MAPDEATHIALQDAVRSVPDPEGRPFAVLMRRGDLSVEIFAPTMPDTQSPHEQDELYVVARGSARFWDGETERDVAAGDLLFVAAHREHRFTAASDDFVTWVVFAGPKGGHPR